LRVVTLAPPSQACAQWHLEEGSPPTVAGAAPDLARFVRAAPDSLLAGRSRHYTSRWLHRGDRYLRKRGAKTRKWLERRGVLKARRKPPEYYREKARRLRE